MIPTGFWPGFVERIATPATPQEISQDIADGYPAVIGGEIPGGVLLATTGQGCLECGARVGLSHDEQVPGYWNGNLGNVRGSFEGRWTSFVAGEGHGSGAVVLAPGPLNRFRSYYDPSAPDLAKARQLGARDFLALLARRYPRALDCAAAKDYSGYVHMLHEGGYFTAAEESYERAEAKLTLALTELPTIAAYLAENLT